MKEKNQSELEQRDEGFITSYTKHFKIQTAICQEVPKMDRPLVAQTRCHKFISGFSLIHAVDFFGLQRMNLSSFGDPVAPPSGQHFDFSTTNIKIYQADYCKIDCRYSWSPENQLILVILSFFGLFFPDITLKGVVYDSGESLFIFELNSQTNTALPSVLLQTNTSNSQH